MLDIDWEQLNKVLVDKFNRVNGIFAINKPIGITSHDVVDQIRKNLGTRKVGHAGALDPFASGLLLILVGKYTKKTDQLIKQDKAYKAKVLIGIKTDSGDIDGVILENKNIENLDEEILRSKVEVLNSNYNQRVPIFSSVKVNGIKLREAARSSDKFEVIDEGGKLFGIFHLNDAANKKIKKSSNDNVLKLEIPVKPVTVDIRIIKIEKVIPESLNFDIFQGVKDEYYSIEIDVDCSKGTYIRQLAEDLGEMIGSFGVLYSLERTRIGDVYLDQAVYSDEIMLVEESF